MFYKLSGSENVSAGFLEGSTWERGLTDQNGSLVDVVATGNGLVASTYAQG
jgi:hypothetical protein